MATFPVIVADHPITEEVKVREQRAGLGDGIEYITRFGLNPVDTTWRVTWTRLSDSERDTIEAFLAARAADGEPFDWTPPDAATAQQFRVDQWEPARTTPTGWALDLVFRQVYETGSALVGEPRPPGEVCLSGQDGEVWTPGGGGGGGPQSCVLWVPPFWDTTLPNLVFGEFGPNSVRPEPDTVATALSSFGLASGKWYLELIMTGTADYAECWVGFAQSASVLPGATGSGGFGVAGSTGVFNDLAGGFTADENDPSVAEAGGNYYRVNDPNINARIAMAIDFGEKRAWLGIFDESSFQWNYDGDPVAGTGAMRSGWTGTPTLRVAVGMSRGIESASEINVKAEFPSGTITPDSNAFNLPPTGFCYWPATEPPP